MKPTSVVVHPPVGGLDRLTVCGREERPEGLSSVWLRPQISDVGGTTGTRNFQSHRRKAPKADTPTHKPAQKEQVKAEQRMRAAGADTAHRTTGECTALRPRARAPIRLPRGQACTRPYRPNSLKKKACSQRDLFRASNPVDKIFM